MTFDPEQTILEKYIKLSRYALGHVLVIMRVQLDIPTVLSEIALYISQIVHGFGHTRDKEWPNTGTMGNAKARPL